MVSPWIIFGLAAMCVILLALIIYVILSWNIPVVVLKYQGDKRRPQVKFTKARRAYAGGVWRLHVRGYKLPMRDFKSKYYYPGVKKHGALVLWEPKPGMLTPVIPKKRKGVKKAEYYAAMSEAQRVLARPVDFQFDDSLYDELLIKAIDDTDIDWLLQEIARVDSQYTVGWRDFLAKHASHIVIVFISAMLLAGFIVWLKESPNMLATCASAAQEASLNVFEKYSQGLGGPPG